MKFVKFLLFPFASLYWLVTSARNLLYDKGFLTSYHFTINTVCIGNLSVGGTGKTPMVEYLVRLMEKKFSIAILSRGYGRKTKGFILAEKGISVDDLGDEPFQYFTKFGNKVAVAVGEERAKAIPSLLKARPLTELVLLDDAYQHRKIVCGLTILITDYSHLFYEDFLLPSGRLRESRSGASRAQIVLVSKCPDVISEKKQLEILINIEKFAGKDVPVYFTKVIYGNPENVFLEATAGFMQNILLITGIAEPHPLKIYIQKHFSLIGFQGYRDHHNYSESDLHAIRLRFEALPVRNKCIVTTEKDMVKFRNHPFNKIISGIPFFYIPIETTFIDRGDEFNQYVLNYIKKNNN